MSALVASCHCGRARITLPRTPDEVTHCNCSLCTKTGFQGIYYPSAELEIEGETDSLVELREGLMDVGPVVPRAATLPKLSAQGA